jgi:Holliday junction DNA helicase RuvA
MIASLRGRVQRVHLGTLVLDVAGVGYLVNVSPALSASLNIGDDLLLHTAYIVREDAHLIFGFAAPEELEMFELLRSVTGVGPKSALGIVSAVGVDEIRHAVANEQDGVFKAVSGIGPKTAKLITVTLAGKFISGGSGESADLIAALVGLGYKESEASAALRQVSGNDAQAKLRGALKLLSGAAK